MHVLIHVVMEEGQRLTDENGVSSTFTVLILVVMEEGQRQQNHAEKREPHVLILVVMEEGQRRVHRAERATAQNCLNPCCNGRGSKT